MSILNLGKVRPVLLGAYSEATEYKFLNGVSYNGSYYFYINETASTGNLPTDTEYWAIAAQKGDKGDLGASIVTAAFVDDDMVFTLDDDTTVTLVGAKTVLKGDKGDMGTIYTPAISEDGVLSFANNGELDNPTPVDLTGPQGNPAPNTIFQYSINGTDWTTVATGAQWYRQSGDNGTTWSEAIAISTTAYADAKVADAIVNGVTGIAPSQNAVYDALALKAPLASPTFTGDIIVPDQTAGNNSTKAANTKYVDAGLGLKADLTYAEYLMMEGDPA